MPPRKLPKMDTPEWEAEKIFYSTATKLELVKRAEGLSMTFDSYQRSMSKYASRELGIVESEPPPALTDTEQAVLDIVIKEATSVSEISRHIDRSSETVIKTIDALRAKHHEVILDETRHEVSVPHEPAKEFAPTDFKYLRKFYRIGIVSDTHLCSKYQQLTLLHDAYTIFDDRQTDFNVHGGDLTEGIDMYREHRQEVFKHNAPEQREYVIDNYPTSKRKTKTYIIGGQHDRSFYKQNGYDIVEHICEKRKDLVYRGFFRARFTIKGLPIELQHPGGGLAYALSYNPQKMVESISGYVLSIMRASPEFYKVLPALLLIGHYHVPMHLPRYMGIDVSTLPCFQAQTPYLQQKKKMPVIGCAVAEIWLGQDNNLSSVKLEYINMDSRVKDKDY